MHRTDSSARGTIFSARTTACAVMLLGMALLAGCNNGGSSHASGSSSAPPVLVNAGVNKIGKTTPEALIKNPPVEDRVFLDGSASDAVSFEWSLEGFTGEVDGSQPFPQYRIASKDSPITAFSATQPGTYTLRLTAGNGVGGMDSDFVEVRLLDDQNGNGLIDSEDSDRDGDGFRNADDFFANDKASHGDFDNNGVSNYHTADVDGDGVPDLHDEMPLDEDTASYPVYEEQNENGGGNNNDGQSVAENAGTVPLKIKGHVSAPNGRVDLDYYKVKWADKGRYTVRIDSGASDMRPTVSIMDGTGTVISTEPAIPATLSTSFASASIPRAGSYFVVISDQSSRSNPAWSYTATIFADNDFDGISNALETALDSNPNNPDSDGDGIPDFVEIDAAVLVGDNRDIDNDSLPPWWDNDSDGDLIPDRLAYFTAGQKPDLTPAQLAHLNDVDGDGVPNFLDSNSDGQWQPDSQEVGLDPLHPVDADGDGIPDFLDVDNDGDGLLDDNDPHPNDPIEFAPPGSLPLKNLVDTDLGPDGVEHFCRPDDTLRLVGLDPAASYTVVIRSSHSTVNQHSQADGKHVAVTCPAELDSGVYEVFAVADNERSLSQPVLVPKDGAPILLSAENDPTTGRLTLHGLNLDYSLSITVSGVGASVDNAGGNAHAVTFPVPDHAQSGQLWVESVKGKSNPIHVNINRQIQVHVELPPGSRVDVTQLNVSGTLVDDAFPDPDGNVTTIAPANGPAIVGALLTLPDSTEQEPHYALYLQTVTLPADQQVNLSALTTAVAMTWQGVGIGQGMDAESLRNARNRIAGLPAVHDLADVLASQLVADPSVMNQSPMNPAIARAVVEAVKAASQNIQQGIAAGDLTPRTSANGSSTGDFWQVFSRFAEPAEVQPSEADNIKVYESSGDSGNITISNDTSLFLSYRVTTQDGRVLKRPIAGFFQTDRQIDPQSARFYISEDKRLNVPHGQDVTVRIYTPAYGAGYDPTEAAPSQIRNILLAKTVTHRMVVPTIGAILSVTIDPGPLAQIMYSDVIPQTPKLGTALRNGDAKGAVVLIINTIVEDFENGGPLSQEFGNFAGKKIAAKFAAKLAAYAVPGLGEVKAIVTAVDIGSSSLEVTKATKDLVQTDDLIDFDVHFPLKVTDAQPGTLRPDGRDKTVVLTGNGFSPIHRATLFFFNKRTLNPHVIVTNTKSGDEITVTPQHVNTDGTKMRIRLPGAFLPEDAEGDLAVKVHHPYDTADAIAELADPIQLINEIRLTALEPEKGGAGDTVCAIGSGFSPLPNENAIMLDGGSVSKVSEGNNKICWRVPQNIKAGTYPVMAQTTINGERETSNSLDFEVVEGLVTITVCDNGSAKDDAFQLNVDGQNLGIMTASNSSYCKDFHPQSLSPGSSHQASLIGIEAPDNIGTYSIGFTGISDFGGDPGSGADLVPGVTKHYTFRVSDTPKKSDLRANGGDPASRMLRPVRE